MTATTAPATTAVLSLQGVSKRFGAVQALKDIDFDVNPGEVVALVGDNGAGKSTLVKTIAGVYTPDAGEHRPSTGSQRRSPPRRGPASRHRHRLPGPRAVRQPRRRGQPLPGPRAHRGRGSRRGRHGEGVLALLRQLRAKIPSVRIPVASLSGGQRQTVAIARSLLGDPKVVMLDEPTAALGVAQTAEVLNLMERLRENGHGVILISHNMSDVMAVADRVVVLRLGRNNGTFRRQPDQLQEIIAAITGATTNAVSAQRAARRVQKEDQ